jgi:2-oxo-4-hydroxy-4-carboxy--5-ureidoimidazoline (OHCU) decarboxylase
VTAAGSLPPIDAVNREPGALDAALGALFGTAGPLAPVLAGRRPFASYDALVGEVGAVLPAMGRHDQVAVVNAHPRLGAPLAHLPDDGLSAREQRSTTAAGAGDRSRLAAGNEAYEERFGFRFVTFVDGRGIGALADELERRVAGRPGDELATALDATLRIAADRAGRLGRKDHHAADH